MTTSTRTLCAACLATALLASLERTADAQTISWKGQTWRVTSGGMAGVCQGSPSPLLRGLGTGNFAVKSPQAGDHPREKCR